MRNARLSLARSAILVLASIVVRTRGAGGQPLTVVHSFEVVGGSPYAGLAEGAGGKLYGTSAGGGQWGQGSVFVMAPDGGGGFSFSNLHSFTAGEDGANPLAGLILASDGFLYGTTSEGGLGRQGTAFRIDTSGNLTTLHQFLGYSDGAAPTSGLIEATDGDFYGATLSGGAGSYGTVYRMNALGDVTILHAFAGGAAGAFPLGGVVEGPDGALYGTTSAGGALGGFGTLYRVTTGGDFETLHVFDGTDGNQSSAALVLGPDGYFYGTTLSGGGSNTGTVFRSDATGLLQSWDLPPSYAVVAPLANADDGSLYGTGSAGVVFRFTTGGQISTIHAFGDGEGSNPQAPVLQASDGKLYGTTVQGGAGSLGTVFRLDTSGDEFATIYSFSGTGATRPIGGLVQGDDQRIYGTAGGGAFDLGTVFRLDLDGTATVLKSFSYADGEPPTSVLRAPDGSLFGTTLAGGTSGYGSVFEIDPGGAFSTVHSFTLEEGAPDGGLTLASDGSLLGAATTFIGVSSIFRIDSLGAYSTLHTFTDSECRHPLGTFVETSGAFAGVCREGGLGDLGSVFRFDEGGGFAVLHEFSEWDGSNPSSPLVLAPDGSLYGLTPAGGSSGKGTIFRVDPSGSVAMLAPFAPNQGGPTAGGPVLGPDGNLYGATVFGGANFVGSLYRIDANGAVTTLFEFSGPDGLQPNSQPFLGADGGLYGATLVGGLYGGGEVFRLALPAAMSVWSVTPTSGPATGGTSATIGGFNFKTSPAVLVGGAAATDVVTVSPNELTATMPAVPAGTLNDVVVTNFTGTSASLARAWFSDFLDVPQADPFHSAIESVFRLAVTAGCGGGLYCRDAAVTRAQMAVFLLKAEHGPGYAPPACAGVFPDVACPSTYGDWIENLSAEGITAGCGGGDYCPAAPVSRAQMAVFLLKTEHGGGYEPPACSGVFGDVPCPGTFADWIERLYAEGITGGCQASPLFYCPDNPNTRGQMAALLVKTFNLP